jgi:uncharacterized protein YidB (DUF937 family)
MRSSVLSRCKGHEAADNTDPGQARNNNRRLVPLVSIRYMLEVMANLNRVLATLLVSAVAVVAAGNQAAAQTPTVVGANVPGTFGDASGHSAQSHLVFASASATWWVFTLTSFADSQGGTNHIVKSFYSSGPDLATATWVSAQDSPPAAAGQCCQFMGSGRALAIAYLNNNGSDVIHAEVAMAADGGNGRTAHIRATVGRNSITWAPWTYFDEPAAIWTLPRATSLGISSGKYIHSAGPILQQEVDANARKSMNPDTGSAWTSGFSSVSVIDNSMINACNAIAFGSLGSNVMVGVYDNGGGTSTCYNCGQTGAPEPNLTNLRYKKSNPDGSWPGVAVGGQGGGDGFVFSSDATINQNDWALVPVTTALLYVFRTTASGSGIDGARYNASTNNWSAVVTPPPAFTSNQKLKSGGGLFGATDGANVWLFFINSDTSNTILYSKFDGTSWTPWAAVPGTSTGSHVRNFIAGSAAVNNGQVGLIWTEGSTSFDLMTAPLPVTATARPPTPPTNLRIIRD